MKQLKYSLDVFLDKYRKMGGNVSFHLHKGILQYEVHILGKTFIVVGSEDDDYFNLELVAVFKDVDYVFRISEEEITHLAASLRQIEESIDSIVEDKYELIESKSLFLRSKYLEVKGRQGTVSFIKVRGKRYQ